MQTIQKESVADLAQTVHQTVYSELNDIEEKWVIYSNFPLCLGNYPFDSKGGLYSSAAYFPKHDQGSHPGQTSLIICIDYFCLSVTWLTSWKAGSRPWPHMGFSSRHQSVGHGLGSLATGCFCLFLLLTNKQRHRETNSERAACRSGQNIRFLHRRPNRLQLPDGHRVAGEILPNITPNNCYSSACIQHSWLFRRSSNMAGNESTDNHYRNEWHSKYDTAWFIKSLTSKPRLSNKSNISVTPSELKICFEVLGASVGALDHCKQNVQRTRTFFLRSSISVLSPIFHLSSSFFQSIRGEAKVGSDPDFPGLVNFVTSDAIMHNNVVVGVAYVSPT